MTDQEILAKPPEGATHFSWDGHYLKYDLNRVLEIYHVNYKHWQQASTWVGVDRSLADIRRIVELEKDRDIRDLEQQAMGLADYVSKVMDSSYILHLDPKNTNHCILINLNAAALRLLDRAQALKEQVKP